MDWLRKLVPWVVPLCLIVLWEYAVIHEILPKSKSAHLHEVLSVLLVGPKSGEFAFHALSSIGRLLAGVGIGAAIGICTGFTLAWHEPSNRLFTPTIQFLAPIPVVVWLPFFIMLFGLGEPLKWGLVAVAAFFLIHLQAFQAAQALDREYAELARMYEINLWGKILHILLPFSAPAILTALRFSLAIGWIVLFVTEYAIVLKGKAGLGWIVQNARQLGLVEQELAGVILLGIIGILLDQIVVRAQRHLLIWRPILQKI